MVDTHMFARVAAAVASSLVLFYVFGWIAILAVVAIAFVIIRIQEMVTLQVIRITVGIMILIIISPREYWI